MRKTLFAALLSLCAFAGNAQEKVMNIVKTDGTRIQTRVEELKQISFLTVSEGGEGLVVKTIGGGTASILFEESPVVTIQKGKLTIKPKTTDAVEFEITDIEEIVFGKKTTKQPSTSLKASALYSKTEEHSSKESPKAQNLASTQSTDAQSPHRQSITANCD
ncbi:MAG: hypothetical protein UHJ41_08805 [Bacteroidaceae bacterium]|nr:hypothetical protein [Bacteroidaceae bacterium]